MANDVIIHSIIQLTKRAAAMQQSVLKSGLADNLLELDIPAVGYRVANRGLLLRLGSSYFLAALRHCSTLLVYFLEVAGTGTEARRHC